MVRTNEEKYNGMLLVEAAFQGDSVKVQRLIPISECLVYDYAARMAIENGHVECVKLLVKHMDEYHALLAAASCGLTDDIRILLPQCDNEAIRRGFVRAAAEGHVESVKLLMPYCDPKANGSNALQWAAKNGHTECVKLLIPVSDPKADKSEALRWAAINSHTECVKLLMPFSDVEAVVKNCNHIDAVINTIDKAEAEMLKGKLAEAIGMDTLEEQAPSKRRRM